MEELKPGLTSTQLEKLRIKALKAANKCEHDDSKKRAWQNLADHADYLNLLIYSYEDLYTKDYINRYIPTYSAGISGDTQSLQTEVVGIAGCNCKRCILRETKQE